MYFFPCHVHLLLSKKREKKCSAVDVEQTDEGVIFESVNSKSITVFDCQIFNFKKKTDLNFPNHYYQLKVHN